MTAFFPQAIEHPARVKDCQGRDCDDDHRTLENHERSLVVCNFARETSLELGDTVDGADIDGDGCESDS